MDQFNKAAQINPLVLKDELENRRVVGGDEADPARYLRKKKSIDAGYI
jgi:hypothetical protein